MKCESKSRLEGPQEIELYEECSRPALKCDNSSHLLEFHNWRSFAFDLAYWILFLGTYPLDFSCLNTDAHPTNRYEWPCMSAVKIPMRYTFHHWLARLPITVPKCVWFDIKEAVSSNGSYTQGAKAKASTSCRMFTGPRIPPLPHASDETSLQECLGR